MTQSLIKPKIFFSRGNDYFLAEDAPIVKKLDNFVYSLKKHPVTGELFLTKIDERFSLPDPMYGLEEKFIERVLKYFNTEKNSNLGIAMNGIKGTGKSVTAKFMANAMNLPVILVNEAYEEMSDFISEIRQDLIIFMDEYEKNISCNTKAEEKLLSLMDGALSNSARRVFILTTNTLNINQYFLQRPSRIRYIKTFNNLQKNVIEEIIDSILIYPEYRDDIIEVVSKLSIITIDLVKAIVYEVNIQNESPKDFENIFNIKAEDYERTVDLYALNHQNKPTLVFKHATVKSLFHYKKGNTFYVDDRSQGDVLSVKPERSELEIKPYGRFLEVMFKEEYEQACIRSKQKFVMEGNKEEDWDENNIGYKDYVPENFNINRVKLYAKPVHSIHDMFIEDDKSMNVFSNIL